MGDIFLKISQIICQQNRKILLFQTFLKLVKISSLKESKYILKTSVARLKTSTFVTILTLTKQFCTFEWVSSLNLLRTSNTISVYDQFSSL